jgi:DNA mismatch endonuclease, patch repair protein
MRSIRSTNNQTELALRKALHAMGLRYRLHRKDVYGKPDIVFPSERIAVFVDGDYWHGRRLVQEGVAALQSHLTAEQQPYWIPKLQRNLARDGDVTAVLRSKGWLVLRYWESDVKRNCGAYARKVFAAVQRRRARMQRLV